MPRMTRAKAAEVAETLHVDADQVLDLPDDFATDDAKAQLGDPAQRSPLEELTVNHETAPQALKTSHRRSKRGKRVGAVDVDDQADSEPSSLAEIADDTHDTVQDEGDSTPSSVRQNAAEDASEDVSGGMRHIQLHHTSASPATTASPLISGPSEQQTGVASLAHSDSPAAQTPQRNRSAHKPSMIRTQTASLDFDAPVSPLPSAMPNVVVSLRKDSPNKRSTSNKENVEPFGSPSINVSRDPFVEPARYDSLESAAVQSATPPRLGQHSETQPAAPIVEVSSDLQGEAQFEVSPAVSDDSDDVRTVGSDTTALPAPLDQSAKETSSEEAPKPRKAAPIVRQTKASQARLSTVNGINRHPALGKPRPSIGFGHSNSVRATSNDSAGLRTTSGESSNDGSQTGKREVIIPHSKPRPMSLSFPTPPPPPRSSKPPTQSTFTLPGEAISAKLKAQREARLAKEAEEEARKRAFKARPVPSSLRQAPVVRPTNTSRARESIMTSHTKDLAASVSGLAPPPSASRHKRSSSAFPASTAPFNPRSTIRAAAPPSISALRASTTSTPRPSTAQESRIRPSNPPPTSTSTPRSSTLAPGQTKGTTKGREVFNRPAQAQHAAEAERRDKEAAARRARDAAAERGRLASREWAEKQRLRKLGLGQSRGTVVSATEGVVDADAEGV